jgi:ribulose bisphosphate carboxylase small subunit
MAKNALISEEKRDEHGRFIVPPVSPGRPKGSRTKLGELFLSELMADFEEHGAQAIKDMREEKPGDYVKVVAATLPKELNVKVSELDDLSDDEIARQLASLASQLARAGIDLGQGAIEALPAKSIN